MSSSFTPDVLQRFMLPDSSVRGALVRLDESWQAIRERDHYPPAIAKLLGEACAATALFGGHTKIDGRLSLQLRGSRSLRTLFAEYRPPGLLRGLAHWAPPVPEQLTLRQLGENGVLALTMESRLPGRDEHSRYQGLVSLDADNLAKACEAYFNQSEQLPTRIHLAVGPQRAAGMLVQLLPESGTIGEAWHEVCALFETLQKDELLELPAETLLQRLFHEQDVRLLPAQPMAFGCSCSRERVASMLRALGRDEARAALEDGTVTIRCEFCGQVEGFDSTEVEALFSDTQVSDRPLLH